MIRPIAAALVLCILGLPACGDRLPPVDAGVSLELAEARSTTISDIDYKLHFTIPADADLDIAGRAEITFVLADNSAPLQLDFRESADKLTKIVSNGTAANYKFSAEHIVLPADALEAGSNRLEIDFIAGSTSLNRNPEFLYTLFVPDRARTAFPLFDQPDLKARYELTLDLPGDWTAISAAPLASEFRRGARRVLEFRRSDLMSSYLFSFVAGKFKTLERTVGGRTVTMLHRETDQEKLDRNVDAIFSLHANALAWLEAFTGIDYPYQKFGFALIPAFQYGGMEHIGAIQYRATSLLLDEAPSDNELLDRAGLIAHETAHMWFGNLVTMRWFDDVWTKEVFANFMAAKIVNPQFPEIDHDLNFLVRHYPAAYSVDRTPGANAIRQSLANLNEAGQMYGAIIYNKAPVMMRQLETLIGEIPFREGLKEYLETYAFSNATWPALIDILDRKSDVDLAAWSHVWVNTPGRPAFVLATQEDDPDDALILRQLDAAGLGRTWPQVFAVGLAGSDSSAQLTVVSTTAPFRLDAFDGADTNDLVFNADGRGYGLFPASSGVLRHWDRLTDLQKGTLLVNLHEQMLDGGEPEPTYYLRALAGIAGGEDNELLLELILGQLQRIYWQLLPEGDRQDFSHDLEGQLWGNMLASQASSTKKIFFHTYAMLAISSPAVGNVFDVWSGAREVAGLVLSENDRIELAESLAIRLPEQSDDIIAAQLAATMNPDSVRRLAFVAPSLSGDQLVRDRFFASLARPEMRTTESWVLDALRNLHHPLQRRNSEQYLRPSLDLLQEIQVTGDIFFPKRWLDETLQNYNSGTARQAVEVFLAEHPDYNDQLRMKILQSADMLVRANAILDQKTP